MVPLALLLLLPARAQDPTDPDAPIPTTPEGWSRRDGEQGRWRDLPLQPREQPDGTAHTLGQGRVRLGFTRQAVGVLDNVDLGTNLGAFLLGFPNASAKVTAIQTEPIDVSVQAGFTWMELGPALQIEDAQGRLVPVRWTGTWTAAEPVSLHLGNTWNIFELEGAFDTADMAAAIAAATGTELDPSLLSSLEEMDESSDVYAGARLLLTQSHLGLDYRINRRDSVLLRMTSFTAMSGTVRGGYRTTDADGSGAEAEIGTSARITVPLQDQVSVLASLSWQWTWRRTQLRIGIPIPVGTNWAFAIPQAFSLHWVLGGPRETTGG